MSWPWWSEERVREDLAESLSHVNDARRLTVPTASSGLAAATALFRGLNKLMSLIRVVLPRDAESESDTSALRRLLRQLSNEDQEWLLHRPSVRHLASLTPPIEDHGVLRDFLLSQPIPDEDRARARASHEALARRFERWDGQPNSRNRKGAMDALAEVLWTIRSNLMHGEKTLAGPDPMRSERNRLVGSSAHEVLEDLIDAVLRHPSRRLVAYGTLGPGGPNHGLVAHVQGQWREVVIAGQIGTVDGLPAFRRVSDGPAQSVDLFESVDLPDLWPELDAFEGLRYQRILIEYRDGDIVGVGNVYEYATDA